MENSHKNSKKSLILTESPLGKHLTFFMKNTNSQPQALCEPSYHFKRGSLVTKRGMLSFSINFHANFVYFGT